MIDVNKPVENPELSALFEERRSARQDQYNDIHNRIAKEIALHAHLLAVIEMDPEVVKTEEGKAVIRKDTVLSFAMFTDKEGHVFMPVFTDWPSLYAGELYKDKAVQTLIVSFDDIVAVTNGNAGAVVNPFTDNFVITPANLARMKTQKEIEQNGVSEQVIQKDTTVQIGDPADMPEEMVKAVTAYAGKDSSIQAVWLKLMIRDGEKSWLLIVDHTGDRNKVFKGIVDAAMPHNHSGMYIDMLEYRSTAGRNASRGEPIYRKKKGLFSFLKY
ncbi:MAG: enhanced serine sensitivity protein SseB [Solobacterium sp.]|nr:enhanced serine sensitivity protein SseB [Solobacterium sp.]